MLLLVITSRIAIASLVAAVAAPDLAHVTLQVVILAHPVEFAAVPFLLLIHTCTAVPALIAEKVAMAKAAHHNIAQIQL